MKNRSAFLRKYFAVLFSVLLLFNIWPAVDFSVNAANGNVTKIEKKYDIAVVFDNSGSMYQDESWCRAKYSMEIFASMLNYGKDVLYIFPMWEVKTDGTTGGSGSYAPIEIKNKAGIDKITNLYTVHPSNTPFAAVREAYEHLKQSQADEKWLVVLTDGEFNQDERNVAAHFSVDDLQNEFASMASEEIKIQYLGFAGAKNLKSDEANYFYASKTSGADLKSALVDICNSIFQRSTLPNDSINGSKLKLDLSMSSVVVFVQGDNASVTSLKDSKGTKVQEILNSGQRKYSQIKAGGYDSAKVDTSLAGQVVTFGPCAEGEYELTYTGANNIQIFYEPDVDIKVSIVNNDGVEINGPDEFVADEYTITSRIVDGVTGEDVTNHELLGNNVKLQTFVKTSENADYTAYENGSKVKFEADEKTDIYIEGKYLDKYTITSKNDVDLNWLTGMTIKEPVVDFKLSLSSEQTLYYLNDYDTWKPIKATVSIDGTPLTDSQLASTELEVEITSGLRYRVVPASGQSSFNIFISEDESGGYIEPSVGKFTLKATATYTDERGNSTTSSPQKVDFEIPSSDFKLSISTSQTSYSIKEHESWQPIKIQLALEGQPLTDNQLKKTKLSVKISDGLKCRVEAIDGESAFNVYISEDENGKYIEPSAGNYNLTAVAVFVDDHGLETTSNTASFDFEIPSVGFNLSASAEQTWYTIKDHENWKPIKIALTFDGQPLTKSQIASTELMVELSDGTVYKVEALPDESAYNIYISRDDDGKYVVPSTGKYKLEVKATYTDEYGKQTESNTDSVKFEIQKYSRIWRIMFWVLIFLVILLVWLMYMLQKVLPKSIVKDTAEFSTMSSGELDASFVNVSYSKKSKTLTISGPSAIDFNEQCSATFTLRAVNNRFTSSKQRRVAVVGIESMCEEIRVAGTMYVNYEGRWIRQSHLKSATEGKAVQPMDQELSTGPRFELLRQNGTATLVCRTRTVK